ncbi:MAG: sulfotransferase [Candidatus Sulfotelmatobacter sp.]
MKNNGQERKNSPVFVVGCHRSGTNLLYDTLLSAGGFAIYRGYLPIYKMLIPRFGGLDRPNSRKKIIEIWLRSKGFRRSGLDASSLGTKLNDSRNGGDFIRIVMDEIAARQNSIRWAVYDADNVLYMPRIKADIPGALFVHIVRDGRDIALSLRKMGGFTPFFWDRKPRGLCETALYWEWMVRTGRRYGSTMPSDYIEVRYEDLVGEPRRTLTALSEFLAHDLDYERIQRSSLGTLRESNSSFPQEEGTQQNPLNRWRQNLSEEEVASIEAVVGDCLEESGYTLITPREERKTGFRERSLRALYLSFLDAKLWFKITTPIGRLTNTSPLELAGPGSQPESIA